MQSYACDDLESPSLKAALALYGIGWCSRSEIVSWIKVGRRNAIYPTRGWNMVVINHMTGAVESTKKFDTSWSRKANHDMKVWVRGIRNKRIIVGVAHIDFGGNLDHRGIETLVSTSSSFDSTDFLLLKRGVWIEHQNLANLWRKTKAWDPLPIQVLQAVPRSCFGISDDDYTHSEFGMIFCFLAWFLFISFIVD